LIEVLIVTAIIGVLAAVLFPAVQSARESSRRTTCTNNLRQLGVAIHSFETAEEKLPSSVRPSAANTVRVAAFTQLLPYLEQRPMWEQYDTSANWSDPANQPVVSRQLEVFRCPSTPLSDRMDGNPDVISSSGNSAWDPSLVGVTDYSASLGVDPRLAAVLPGITAGVGVLPKNKACRFQDIRDGQSQTIMLIEAAGRPFVYRRGGVLVSEDQSEHRVNGGGWPRPASDLLFMGSNRSGTIMPPTSPGDAWAINAANGDDVGGDDYPHPMYGTEGSGNPFSFHATGANMLFADGSVKLLDEEIDIVLYSALVTRAGNEPLSGRY
jgi:prepilin-type processing-associated H-X9-DG protein